MAKEYCELCDEPTGRAGVGDDSIVCEICGRIICKNCAVDENGAVVCTICHQAGKFARGESNFAKY